MDCAGEIVAVPLTVEYDRANGLLEVTATGLATPELFREAMEAITSSESFPPDVDALWDLRGLEFGQTDAGFLRRLLSMRAGAYASRGKARVALLVGSDLQYGVGRQYELMSDDIQGGMAVFRSREEARAWLRRD